MAERVANTDFTDVDLSADAQHFVNHLDLISSLTQVQAYKQRMFDLLEVRTGSSVLDVGCGTGDDARALAKRVGESGKVVGLDSSKALLCEARERAEGQGLPIDFRLGDARDLEFSDGTFDACRIDRVLHHLEDPRAAVDELVRVARPGAMVVMHEPDMEMILVDAGDRDVTRRIMNFFTDRHPSGWVGRRLHALAREAGLNEIVVEPDIWILTDHKLAMRLLWLDKTAAAAVEAGATSQVEAEGWVADLAQAGAQDRFFAAAGFFILSGRKG